MVSCLPCVLRRDRTIDWLILTDCAIPRVSSPNITFVPMTVNAFNELASDALGVRVCKNAYSQLDLRPAYGVILADRLVGYDFWGHVDVDVVWGDIRRFLPEQLLRVYDIVSSRQNALAGHFTLYRNDLATNTIFRHLRDWPAAVADPRYHHIDEKGMGIFLKYRRQKHPDVTARVFWQKDLVDDWWALARRRSGWVWQDGRLYDGFGRECMYMHFMTWKRHMRHIDFAVEDVPQRFCITHRGVWSQPMRLRDRLRLRLPLVFVAESYARYLTWYWVDRRRWLSRLRLPQHAKRG